MSDNGTIAGENIIILSSDDWWSGLKTSKYHVARQLAKRNRVLFVNSVGLRAPTAGAADVRRVVSKLREFARGPVRVPEGLYVYSPIAFPFGRGTRAVGALNCVMLETAMRYLQRRMRLADPLVFSFLPAFNPAVGVLGAKAVVYYCIDDMRGYPDVNREWYDREEAWLLRRADCVIACSKKLQEGFGERGWNAHYVPHGVDWTLFRRAVEEDLPLPGDMRDIPEPRLGFYGFLSHEVVDHALLLRIAADRPSWHIVLIGRPKVDTDMSILTRVPNIHYLGMKRFEDLPAYTRHFAVGLMPFILMGVTWNSNPLKMWEYLAGGLPVVSTDIPEVRQYRGLVRIGHTHDEFIAQCQTALSEGDAASRDRRSRAVQQDSWENRMVLVSDIVRKHMATRVAR
jgi:glycosyltransferase involved in cell wall biosynthesis